MRAIDLFAGLGGFTCGAELAGVQVIAAANHWKLAVQMHQANHPGAAHYCQDLCQADFTQFPAHDLLLASPACQGHAKARGKDRPHHDACRSTAWAVVACAEVHKPAFILVENVVEFTAWVLYPAWKAALQALGYAISENLVDAADRGVPQHRERMFVLCTRSQNPLRLNMPLRPLLPGGSVIDWSSGTWSDVIRPGRAPKTLARIAAGRQAHGKRFFVAYYGTERGGRALSDPLGTVTTRDRFAVVDGDRMRMLMPDEYRLAMGFPHGTVLPACKKLAVHLLGNAVCPPVARDILRYIQAVA
jgi:DNA (cytosine-5)-methyltransferase 1